MSKELVRQLFGANAANYVVSDVHAKGASLARLVELVAPKADWQALAPPATVTDSIGAP